MTRPGDKVYDFIEKSYKQKGLKMFRIERCKCIIFAVFPMFDITTDLRTDIPVSYLIQRSSNIHKTI